MEESFLVFYEGTYISNLMGLNPFVIKKIWRIDDSTHLRKIFLYINKFCTQFQEFLQIPEAYPWIPR